MQLDDYTPEFQELWNKRKFFVDDSRTQKNIAFEWFVKGKEKSIEELNIKIEENYIPAKELIKLFPGQLYDMNPLELVNSLIEKNKRLEFGNISATIFNSLQFYTIWQNLSIQEKETLMEAINIGVDNAIHLE
jgi:hypothetical protein